MIRTFLDLLFDARDVVPPNDARRTAMHEASHALMVQKYGFTWARATILRMDNRVGSTLFVHKASTHPIRLLGIVLAGLIGERDFCVGPLHKQSFSGDVDMIHEYLAEAMCHEDAPQPTVRKDTTKILPMLKWAGARVFSPKEQVVLVDIAFQTQAYLHQNQVALMDLRDRLFTFKTLELGEDGKWRPV